MRIGWSPLDLVALTRELVPEYGQATDMRAIRFETDVASLTRLFDPVRLRRLAGNLLSNAVKYSRLVPR